MAAKRQTAKTVNMFQYEVGAPANSTLLDFPADEYGLCVELRKAMIKLASRLHGDQHKLRVAERNLALLIGHMYSRYAEQGGVLPVAAEPAPNKQTYAAPQPAPETTEPEQGEPATEHPTEVA